MNNKKPRGPKPKIPHDDVFKALEDVRDELFDSNGNLIPYTSNIWSTISNGLDGKITTHSLYISVYQDRHSWLSRLKNSEHFPNIQQSSIIIKNKSDDESLKSSMSNSSINIKKNIKRFSIDISYRKFIKMKPTTVLYGKKNKKKAYTTLKPGFWTNIINDEFLKNYKMPCTYIYKRCRIYNSSNSEHYLTFQGQCKDCGVYLHGWSDHKPQEGFPLKLFIETRDTRGSWEEHYSKRPLNGYKRSIVGKALSKDTAGNWRRQAVSSIDFGDHLPPNIYNNSVLWKCKQQFIDSSLGITENCPIKSLIELKYGKYAGSIHTISAAKLFILYWTPSQLVIYKHVQKSYCRLSIDATGGLIKKINRTKQGILSGHIFLYEAVLNTNSYQVPVTQMVSEQHDTLTIFYWLAQWLKDGVPIPQETTCDYSKALLGAISRAFCNGITLYDYVEKCFNILYYKISNSLPCYIRIDIAHLVKLVCRWKCLTGTTNYRLKEFYVRCVMLLIRANCLEEFENVLLDILTVSISQTEGEQMGSFNKCPAEEARIRLLNKIRGTTINENILSKYTSDNNCSISDNSDEEIDVFNTNGQENSKINEFLNRIKTQSISYSLVEGDRISPYYLPDFTKNLLRLCKDFPLWSNIMRSIFKSPYTNASSASVEGDFALLKNNILKHKTTPMIVDRFLVTHLMSIESTMKIARSSQLEEYKISSINEVKNNKSNKVKESDKPITPIMSPACSFDSLTAGDLTGIEFNNEINHQDFSDGMNVNRESNQLVTPIMSPACSFGSLAAEDISDSMDINKCNNNEKYDYDYEKDITQRSSPTYSFSSTLTVDEEERWGGYKTILTGPLKNPRNNAINTEKNKKRQTKFIDTCPEIDRILNRSRMRSHLTSVILNGNIAPLCKFNKKTYVVSNTCPFDSVIVAVAVAYIDYETYASYINESKNEFLNLAKELGLHGSSKTTYNQRLKLLLPYFDISTCIPAVNTLNAECNIIKVVQDYLKDDPSSIQIIKCSNTNCSEENRTRNSATIILNNLNKIHTKGFSYLQNLLEKYLRSKTTTCSNNKCDGILTTNTHLGNHIFIEADTLSLNSKTYSCHLNEIPVKIDLNLKKYALVAVVHYVSFHYMTYVRRAHGKWERHNDLEQKIKKIKSIEKTTVNPHLILYIETND